MIDVAAPDRPLLIYDGDSRLCCATIDRWREALGERIHFLAYQEAEARLPQTAENVSPCSVRFIATDGTVSHGAEAVLRTMAYCGRRRWLLYLYRRLPPLALAAEACYRLTAVSRWPQEIVRRIWYGKDLKLPTYHIATALFLRLLGVVYLIAFVSLWTQIDGLVGDHGILPVKNYLVEAERQFAAQSPPVSPVWNLPTLAWISPHDDFLHLLCGAGTVLSVLLILGVLPLPTLILLWLVYLSLFHAGQDFLSFQWDILLLETGMVAIFMAPWTPRWRWLAGRHAPRIAIWLVWWLLFRLMFESGAVKLTWSNWQVGPGGLPVANTWRSLTALDYHYWTQPLPIWTSWYAAKLPEWFQKLSVVFVFIVELGLPWLIFGPRRLRYVACGGIMLLMLLIGATGNYNFFNLLTMLLALTLLDDRAWPQFLQRRIKGTDWPALASPTRWRSLFLMPFACLAVALGAWQVKEAVAPRANPPLPPQYRWNIAQFCLVNEYGLFRRMTETRPEIWVEGSSDGSDWKVYEFRWKPGNLSRPPGFNMPHQPRLDWQMWFEALHLEQMYRAIGTIDPRYMSPWFQSFLARLLHGEPAVVGLLEKNPFPDRPPKFIRLSLYEYRFTTMAEWRQKENWWHCDQIWIGPGWSLAR